MTGDDKKVTEFTVGTEEHGPVVDSRLRTTNKVSDRVDREYEGMRTSSFIPTVCVAPPSFS